MAEPRGLEGAEFEADIGGPRRLECAFSGDGRSLRATVRDESVLPHLTALMLGPSREYAPVRVVARARGAERVLECRVTGSVQRPGSVEISMEVLGGGPN